MQIQKLIETIEMYAPPEYALEWDRCGIQVAGTKQDIKKMAMALDPDEKTIEQAISLQADFLLTHHPLSLKPRLPDKPDSFHKILKNLLASDTTLYSAHTSLDVNPRGPATWLAQSLALENLSVLEPVSCADAVKLHFQHPLPLSSDQLPCRYSLLHTAENDKSQVTEIVLPRNILDLFTKKLKGMVWPFYFLISEDTGIDLQFGLGFRGTLTEPAPFDIFINNLKNILGIDSIIQCGDSPDTVSTVSCCPGSGGDFAGRAFASGSQVFITGDIKYHQAKDAALHGCVLDVGHFILEEKMMLEWSVILKHHLSDMDIVFIKGEQPFRIL